eukprot:13845944-Alexandrium_andersonii.AAC.1
MFISVCVPREPRYYKLFVMWEVPLRGAGGAALGVWRCTSATRRTARCIMARRTGTSSVRSSYMASTWTPGGRVGASGLRVGPGAGSVMQVPSSCTREWCRSPCRMGMVGVGDLGASCVEAEVVSWFRAPGICSCSRSLATSDDGEGAKIDGLGGCCLLLGRVECSEFAAVAA